MCAFPFLLSAEQELHAHLEEQGVSPGLYLPAWLVTGFAKQVCVSERGGGGGEGGGRGKRAGAGAGAGERERESE